MKSTSNIFLQIFMFFNLLGIIISAENGWAEIDHKLYDDSEVDTGVAIDAIYEPVDKPAPKFRHRRHQYSPLKINYNFT
ncbi:Neuropeptide-Like Protein [Caenorhabditis elegans]|uniref:Neuropeptide-Like Protein n=1 Tax=Caenorhabditis elegans TaxID=6239 RepID=E1B6V5_CAEEL|nr:Neuropeptide-Like Protein [Caenorhabditis elegans]CBW48391.1 Neuropeptide-Like Protein [Caenorhabditis elegans]|eukprot:NP_001256932.1 Uncharacterized protein CELE_F46B3.23 [Caenorhabditis elegans]